MSAVKRTVHPADQPLRPAIALVVTTVLMGLALAGTSALGLLVEGTATEPMATEEVAPRLMVSALIAVVLVLATAGLGLATFVLAIVVTVKADGRLRLGAALMVIAALFGLVVSFSVSGDTSQLPDAAVAAANLFSILETIVDVLRALLMLAGVVILVLGIRQVRRERAELSQA